MPRLQLRSLCSFSRGVLKEIDLNTKVPDDGLVVVVDFPEVSGWKGLYSEIEPLPGCGLEVSQFVMPTSFPSALVE